MNKAQFVSCSRRCALLALSAISAHVALGSPQQADCKVYEQQEQAGIAARMRMDPSIHGERLDTVFYSVKRNSCLASVFFTKGDLTYGAIITLPEGGTLWAKSYKGIRPSPARIVEMDRDMDDEIKALEFGPETAVNSGPLNILPLLLDRTMNTLPAIRNAFTDER